MLNRRLFTVALVWLTLVAVNSAAQTDSAASPKAVFVIVDGIPADVIERVPTPTIDAIAAAGGYGRATVGGPIDEPGETPTISAPGYMSLITGTWANKHNVYKNYGISPDYRYWNLFRLARSEKPELQLAIFSTWTDNRTILLGEGLAEAGDWRFDVVVDGLEEDAARFPPRPSDAHIADIDDAVSRDAARLIESEGPDLSWLYLQYTDDVGHEHGDSPDSMGAEWIAPEEKCWGALRRSTAWCMSVGTLPILINGWRRAPPAGATPTACPTSSVPSAGWVEPTPTGAARARSTPVTATT